MATLFADGFDCSIVGLVKILIAMWFVCVIPNQK